VYVIQKVYQVLAAPELVQIFALLLDLGRRQLLRLEPFHKLLLANNEILQMLANFELFTLTLSRQLLSLLLCQTNVLLEFAPEIRCLVLDLGWQNFSIVSSLLNRLLFENHYTADF